MSVINFDSFNENLNNGTLSKVVINTKLSKIKYDFIYINNITNMYVCGYCKAEYSFLSSIKRHVKTCTCIKRLKTIEILNNNKLKYTQCF